MTTQALLDMAESPIRFPEKRVGPAPAALPRVSLVIPAKNEARNLHFVLAQLPACVDEVILVDGNSSDVSCAVARQYCADVRIVSSAPGKGNALRAGFAAARGEIIVAIDADGSMSPSEIPSYLHFLDNGFDFVKGSRFIAGGGSLDFTRARRLGNLGLLMVARYLYQVRFTDLCYGFFAFRRTFLDSLDLQSSGFEIETEISVRAHLAGLRIAEVPSLELPRRSGASSLHAVRDGRRVLATLFAERRRHVNHPPALVEV